jgi:hypothetical protein
MIESPPQHSLGRRSYGNRPGLGVFSSTSGIASFCWPGNCLFLIAIECLLVVPFSSDTVFSAKFQIYWLFLDSNPSGFAALTLLTVLTADGDRKEI